MKYYPIGEAKFADMIEQLKRAEHFIFMEYFIVAKKLYVEYDSGNFKGKGGAGRRGPHDV